MLDLPGATRLLRAAGETTRLRLLALCALREWSVTELAAAVGQSEPRVSRHLKVLCDAGLLRRVRQGQWVCYSVADEGDGAWLVATLLARIDTGDAMRRRDAQRAAAHARDLRPAVPRSSKLGRAVAAFIADSAPAAPLDRVLLVEPMQLELIDAAAAIARRVTIAAARAPARAALRAHCEQRGIDAVTRAGVANGAAVSDGVILDLTGLPTGDAVDGALRAAHRWLAQGAPLWVVLPYEFVEYARGNVVAHPLTELRRLLAAAGLRTEKLKPIDEDTHVLVAFARHADTAMSAAS